MMLIEEMVLEKLRILPPIQQREVLNFVEFLEYRQKLSLDTVLTHIRERAASYNVEEIDSLVEEARADFHHRQNFSRAD